jgi:hypothetical protein
MKRHRWKFPNDHKIIARFAATGRDDLTIAARLGITTAVRCRGALGLAGQVLGG